MLLLCRSSILRSEGEKGGAALITAGSSCRSQGLLPRKTHLVSEIVLFGSVSTAVAIRSFSFSKRKGEKRKSTRKNDNNQGLLNSRSPSFRANNLFASLPSFPIGRLRGRRCNEPLHPEFSLASLSLPELANETGTGNGAASLSLSIIKGTGENGSRSRQLRASSPTVYRRSL